MTVTVLHVPTADLARALPTPAVSVEAEYGSYVLEGADYTAAHHQQDGPYAGRHLPGLGDTGRPSPCNDPAIPLVREGVVAVSHIDLDTIGGVLRALGGYEHLFELRGFWELAEFVDVSGPHRLDAGHSYARELHAVWSWLQANRPQLPRDAVADVTAFMRAAGDALDRILLDADAKLLAAGDAFAAATADLERRSYRVRIKGERGSVVVRQADTFVNHLYGYEASGERQVALACVALNTTMGSVTVSLESPVAGVSAREIVQSLWGPDAGGHDGIAGSPRGRVMTEADLLAAADAVADALWVSL